MPHSSGGGSHGGGSHGGSHGGYGGGARHRVSHSSFPGATRYVYYKNNQPVIVYADYDVRQQRSPFRFVLLLFYIPFFLVFGIGMGKSMVNIPTKVKVDYDDRIVIEDRIDVIGNEDKLEDTLEEFLDKTGIAPAVITVNNEDWNKNYTSLENYAYDLYVNHFDDEKHWLIVYSQPVNAGSGFNDWYWEGMQGDDTDKVLTQRTTSVFNSTLQKNLLAESPDEAIRDSFESFTPVVMKVYINWGMIPLMLIVFGFLGVHCFFMVFYKQKDSKYLKDAIVCNEEFIRQETCNYCGGVYVVGHHLSCPHCQAPVQAHDYTVDSEGRITGIIN